MRLKHYLKRLHSIRYSFYWGFSIVFVLLYISHKLHLFCLNIEVWPHINKICNNYEKQLAQGSLCIPLCDSDQVFSLTCQSDEQFRFVGLWRDTKLVFKKANATNRKFHSENEFLHSISNLTKNMLNTTISLDVTKRLTHLRSSYIEQTIEERWVEMSNIWMLVQDIEYLLALVHSDKDMFPQVLGTCGNFFAIEYIEAIPEPFSLWDNADTKENWGRRLKVAVLILEFIDELDNNFREPLHLCDIHLDHFGVIKSGNRVKFIDMHGVYPRAMVNKLLGNIQCQLDEDCEVLDCRGRCRKETGLCTPFVTNSNLQIVCEKVFLGWRMSNRLLIPGLLMSEYAPIELMSIVRQCANPQWESGKPRTTPISDIGKQLYEILIDVEQRINTNY